MGGLIAEFVKDLLTDREDLLIVLAIALMVMYYFWQKKSQCPGALSFFQSGQKKCCNCCNCRQN